MPGIVPFDFEATIQIFSAAEGGRTSPVFNSIRWDFAYAADGSPPREVYMIWPTFLDSAGVSISRDVPLPVGVLLRAAMTIVIDEMRSVRHREAVAPGVDFFCHEGTRRMASGVVTSILNLHMPRRNTATIVG